MLLLDSTYISADEYLERKNINAANVSMLKNRIDEEYILELGNCTFFKKSNSLPRELKKFMLSNPMDMTNFLPARYLELELGVSKNLLLKYNIIKEEKEIFSKRFYELGDFFKDKRKKVFYTMDNEDFEETTQEINLEYIQIKKNKYLTWY